MESRGPRTSHRRASPGAVFYPEFLFDCPGGRHQGKTFVGRMSTNHLQKNRGEGGGNSARQGPGGSGETKTGLRGPGGRTPKSCSRKPLREHDFTVALRVRVAPLGASSCFSGPSWGSFGGQFWAVGGPGWAVLGLSWAVLEGSGRRGALLGPPTTLWGASGGRIGALLAAFWGSREPS